MKTIRFLPILAVALVLMGCPDRPVDEPLEPVDPDEPPVTVEPFRPEMREGVQVVEVITVDQTGFDPSHIHLTGNTEARLVFERRVDDFCETIRADEGLGFTANTANLLTGQRTDVSFTPQQPGEFRVWCDDRPNLAATFTVQ